MNCPVSESQKKKAEAERLHRTFEDLRREELKTVESAKELFAGLVRDLLPHFHADVIQTNKTVVSARFDLVIDFTPKCRKIMLKGIKRQASVEFSRTAEVQIELNLN